MNEINYGKCLRIAQEIGELLEARKVTVSDATYILNTVIGHASDIMGLTPFKVHLTFPAQKDIEKQTQELYQAEATEQPCKVPSTVPD